MDLTIVDYWFKLFTFEDPYDFDDLLNSYRSAASLKASVLMF